MGHIGSLWTHLLFNFQHRAGVRLHTLCFHFAESCVFSKQSLLPLFCEILSTKKSSSYPEVTRPICRVPSPWLSHSPLYSSTYPPESVLGTVFFLIHRNPTAWGKMKMRSYFQKTFFSFKQSSMFKQKGIFCHFLSGKTFFSFFPSDFPFGSSSGAGFICVD